MHTDGATVKNECQSKDIFRMRNTFDSKMNCVSTMM